MSQLADAALQKAITQINQKENPIGSNWGHPVQDYLARVNIDFPASWCMAFMYWCYDEAAKGLGIVNPLIKTAGVLNAWNNAKGHQELFPPQIGDIFIMDFGSGHGHTGIVESSDDYVIHTIEGNTNDTGSREGYEVIRKTRQRTSIKGYLRY